jgi:hypothetical protein
MMMCERNEVIFTSVLSIKSVCVDVVKQQNFPPTSIKKRERREKRKNDVKAKTLTTTYVPKTLAQTHLTTQNFF